jgi:hypothetical protein
VAALCSKAEGRDSVIISQPEMYDRSVAVEQGAPSTSKPVDNRWRSTAGLSSEKTIPISFATVSAPRCLCRWYTTPLWQSKETTIIAMIANATFSGGQSQRGAASRNPIHSEPRRHIYITLHPGAMRLAARTFCCPITKFA